MRKPSDLKMYVDNKIKELSETYFTAQGFVERNPEDKWNEHIMFNAYAQLQVLFKVRELCEKRKRY